MHKSILLIIAILISCNSKESNKIKVVENDTQIDSLYITGFGNERIFKTIATREAASLKIDSTFIGVIGTLDGKKKYQAILHPGQDLNIIIKQDSILQTDQKRDSILNYILKSTNQDFLAEYGSFIFGSNDFDSLLSLSSSFKEKRAEIIRKSANGLDQNDKDLLLYQSDENLNSFLFYYGKFIKKLPPESTFFDFINDIDHNHKWARIYSWNKVYKYDINYLRENDSIENIQSFLNYIETKTKSKDIADFMKAEYIRLVIEKPSRWEHHQSLLSSQLIKDLSENEKGNPYLHLIQKSINSFVQSQKGEKAFNFTASNYEGGEIKLNDFKGKIVYIDNWATWCAPCIEHRPFVLKIAERYKDNPKVEVLMISMDESKSKWINYLEKKEQLGKWNDLFIQNGMQKEYGNRFNIKSIPKYILIDQNGEIINSDLADPSENIIKLIDSKLNQI